MATRLQLVTEARDIFEEGIVYSGLSVLTATGSWNDMYNWAVRDVCLDSLCYRKKVAAQVVKDCVVSVTMTNDGSGYTSAPAVTIVQSANSTAKGYATIDSAGTVTGVHIETPGSGYTSAAITVTIADPATGVDKATGTAVLGCNDLLALDDTLLDIDEAYYQDRPLTYADEWSLQDETGGAKWYNRASGGTPTHYINSGVLQSSTLRLYPRPTQVGALVEVWGPALVTEPAIDAADPQTCDLLPPADKAVVQKIVMYACEKRQSDIVVQTKFAMARRTYYQIIEDLKARSTWPMGKRVILGIRKQRIYSQKTPRWEKIP